MEPKMSADEFAARRAIFAQFDKQMLEQRSNQAYVKLNNLYLAVERGSVKMSITVQNDLYQLAGVVYPSQSEPVMSQYWLSEFEKLPNWFEF